MTDKWKVNHEQLMHINDAYQPRRMSINGMRRYVINLKMLAELRVRALGLPI
jgi:hypothetical protein